MKPVDLSELRGDFYNFFLHTTKTLKLAASSKQKNYGTACGRGFCVHSRSCVTI